MNVTKNAKVELNRILETRALDPGKYLRLTVPPAWTGEGDFGIVIDDDGEGDQAVDFEGRKVLIVGVDLEDKLRYAILDFKESPDGPRFTLDVF